MMSEANCLFCKMLTGAIPVTEVYRSETVLGFADIAPQAPIHYVFIHQEHSDSHLNTENPQVFAALMQAAQTVAKEKALSDYRLVINNGAEAGQSIFHLHLHLLAGRLFTWPPG